MALVKDFSKIAGSSFVNLLIGLFTTPLITRLVEPAHYGNWSLFCIYSTVLSSVLLLGTDFIIVRFYYKNNDRTYRSALVKWCCLVSLLAVLLMGIPIVFFLNFVRPNWSWFILCLLVFYVVLNVLNRLTNIVLRFEDKINVLSISTILHKVIFVCIAVISLYSMKGYHFEILSISSILSTGLTIILCYYFISHLFSQNQEIKILLPKKEMLSYGFPLMISGCSYLLFQTTDKMIISHFCSETDLGVYSSASSFLSLFAVLQSSFTTVWWPTVMKNYEENPENKSMYVQANDCICFIMSLVGFTFILFKDIFILLLGVEYRSAVEVLPFIIFQPILYTLSETTVIGLNFQKKSKVLLLITITSLIFNVLLNILFTKYYGILGTSIAVGLSYVFFLLLRTLFSYRLYKIDFHFCKMFVCVILLFLFALVNSIYPDNLLSRVCAVILYLVIFILYKDVLATLRIKLLKTCLIKNILK